MDKRNEIKDLLCRELPVGTTEQRIKYVIDKIISITNRIRCPECGGEGKEPYCVNDGTDNINYKPCLHCKDGWIYPDCEKMFEALERILEYLQDEPDADKHNRMESIAKQAITVVK